jgi:glycosyltransferase involved in cell wall biosynthesis
MTRAPLAASGELGNQAPARVLLTTPGGWHLPRTAQAMDHRAALAGLWISGKSGSGVPAARCRRCWPFHLAMMPFYLWTSQICVERTFYALFPIWKAWFSAQRLPSCNVIQAITGFGTEPFDRAEEIGALKVADCPNSHPVSYYGFWQRECDIWCPGEKVPIPQWMFARMNRELERADLVLCPSTFVRETMLQNGIAPEKCMVNPFGVDTSVFQKRTSLPAHPRFVTVGTLCLRKGHQYLFPAFEIVKRRLPEAELICVGGYKSDFRRERKKWQHCFTHIERLTHEQMAALFQSCTAFVLPSLEEGFARVLSEGMSAGLPIVATHESGATTLVEDGREGFIVRSRDPARLAAAMLRLAEDPELNRRLGEAAYQKGAVRNTWQDYGDRLLAEYQARLNHRGPRVQR